MADGIHTHERHRPLIEELREGMVDSYVGMLHRLYKSIAVELKRARGLTKSDTLLVVQGGGGHDNAIATRLVVDLVKAGAPASTDPNDKRYKNNPDYRFDQSKHRWVRVRQEEAAKPRPKGKPEDKKSPKGKKPEEAAASKKPAKDDEAGAEGAWFADEAGNVRFALAPKGRYKRQLSEEEAKQLYQNINNVITEITGGRADAIAEFMEVDLDVLTSLADCVGTAQSKGKTVEEVFIEDYVQGLEDEDEDGNPLTPEDKQAAAHDAYSDMVEAYKELVEDESWKKYSQRLISNIRKDSANAAEAVKRQRKLVKGLFDKMMSGDTRIESMKMLGVVHDLGLIFIPENLTDAKRLPGVESDGQAYKLIGTAHANVDRFAALSKFGEALDIEQQTALAIMTLVNEAQQSVYEGALDVEWDVLKDNAVYGWLRRMQAEAGREFSDDEWDQVREKLTESSRVIYDTMTAFNEEQGKAIIFRALQHGRTSLEQLIKNPKELERLQQLQDELEARMARAVAAQESDDVEIDPIIEKALKARDKDGGLFSFQKQAVNWMQEIEAGILAFGPGTGKTPIATTYISNLIRQGKEKRGIITVPTGLVDQWAMEISRFRPGSKVLTIVGDAKERRMLLEAVNRGDIEAEYVIVPDSTLDMLTEESSKQLEEEIALAQKKGGKRIGKVEAANILIRSGILQRDGLVQAFSQLEGAAVADEIHLTGLKESSNVRHVVMREALKNRKHKFGMTATPMTKGPEDLFTLMNLFNPGSAGESLARFAQQFTKFEQVTDEEGNSSIEVAEQDVEDLAAAKKAIKPFVFFRSKIEKTVQDEMIKKGKKLSALNSVSHPLTMPGVAGAEYNACAEIGYDNNIEPFGGRRGRQTDAEAEADMRARNYSERSIQQGLQARARTRQLMASISPRLVNKDYKGPEPKLEAVVEIVKRHFAEGVNSDKPIVIFGNLKDGLALTEESLVKAGMPKSLIGIYSGDTSKERRAAIKDAINAGKMKVVLVSPAGGTGLNLQKASNRMIFLDKPWTPAQIDQMLGRVWRTGNPNEQVHVHHMGVVGTIDDDKFRKNKDRISFADALTVADKGLGAMSDSIMTSLKNMLGQMHSTVEDWTPGQKKEILTRAGLRATDDVPAFYDMAALKNDVKIEEFEATVEEAVFKEVGDVRVGAQYALNEVKLKQGVITKEQHDRAKRKIAKEAQRWLGLQGKDAESKKQYVARYIEDFDWKNGDGGTTVGDRSKGLVTRDKGSSKAAKKAPTIPLQHAKGSLKLTPQSSFKLVGVSKNPYNKSKDTEWPFWEVLRRDRPTSYADAVAKLSQGIYEMYKNEDEPMSKADAKKITLKYVEKKKILHKFAEKGLIEVLP